MAQNWTDNTYAPDHVGQTDLQNIEYNFACLKSMFSGGSAPSNPVAGMPWFDTTQLVLKIRNSANNAWFGLMHGDTDQKVWVYRDSAMDGWAVDSSVTDRVIAVKGGSEAYNVSGGNLAGTWTQPSHSHTTPAHQHDIPIGYSSGNAGLAVSYANGPNTTTGYKIFYGDKYFSDATYPWLRTPSGGAGTTSSTSPSNTWRPAAAVGTLQYLDL